jgi:MFS family permease
MYKRLSPAVAVVCFAIVSATYIVNAMDRVVFPVLLPQIADEFHFPLATGGLLATLFTLGLGIAGVPGSYLFSHLKRKHVAVLGIAVYSLCTILICYSKGFYDMAAYRVVSGVGEALQNMAVFTIAGSYFYRSRSIAIGSLVFAYGLGSFIAPRLGVSLLIEYQSWRIPLYVFGALGVLGAVVLMFFISSRLTEQRANEAQEASVERNEEHIPVGLVCKNTLLLTFTAMCAGLAAYGYAGLYPTYLMTHLHFSLATTGTVASMFGAGSLVAVFAGYLSDRLNQKRVCLSAIVAMMISGYLIFNGSPTAFWQGTFSFIEGSAYTAFLYINLYSLMQRSVRSDETGRASGLMVTSLYLPAALSGYLFAKLQLTFGWGNAAMLQLCVPLAACFIAMLFFDLSRTSCRTPVKQINQEQAASHRPALR